MMSRLSECTFGARPAILRGLQGLRNDERMLKSRLQEFGTTLAAIPDLTSVLREALKAAMELQRAEFGDVQLCNLQTKALEVAVQLGISQAAMPHFQHVYAHAAAPGKAALRRRGRVIINDVRRDAHFEDLRPVAAIAGFRRARSTPLFERDTGHVVGVISTYSSHLRFHTRYRQRLTDLYACQAADVIACRLAERRLHENEERLRLAFEAAHMGLWEWDPETNQIQSDAMHQALFGLPPRDGPLPLAAYCARMVPEDVQQGIEHATQAIRTGTDIDLLQRIIQPDGTIRWIRSLSRRRRAHPQSFIGVSYDVTLHVRAREALQKSEAWLKAAVDLVQLGLYAWDPQTNKLHWDDTIRAMWGLPPQAPVTYGLWQAGIHPDDLPRVEAAVQRCIDPDRDGIYHIEYRVIGIEDRVERWIATFGRTAFKHRKPVWFDGVAIDITDRKRAELVLERLVEERTRALEKANRQLRQQIQQREDAEDAVHQLQRLDAIGQITSGVAHDFNNLLGVIQINADLMLRAMRDADNEEALQLIRDAAERGGRLIAQLMAFARKQHLEPQAIDLNAKISAMMDFLVVILGGKVRLETRLRKDLWPVLLDPTQIEVIVVNLAINARDAMEVAGTLTLETGNVEIASEPLRPEEPSPGRYVVLRATDTGSGIPDHVLPRIFEPFFTTKEAGKGSGLGLTQVLRMAKQSGGGVRVETHVGVGTSISVFLTPANISGDNGGLDFPSGTASSRSTGSCTSSSSSVIRQP